MKRCYVGAAVLLLLLGLGLLSSRWMDRFHTELSQNAEQAAEAALAEDWETALSLTRRARKTWEARRDFAAILADHAPLEEVDTLFSLLEAGGIAGDPVAYAEVCTRLSGVLEALAEDQELSWANLL